MRTKFSDNKMRIAPDARARWNGEDCSVNWSALLEDDLFEIGVTNSLGHSTILVSRYIKGSKIFSTMFNACYGEPINGKLSDRERYARSVYYKHKQKL